MRIGTARSPGGFAIVALVSAIVLFGCGTAKPSPQSVVGPTVAGYSGPKKLVLLHFYGYKYSPSRLRGLWTELTQQEQQRLNRVVDRSYVYSAIDVGRFAPWSEVNAANQPGANWARTPDEYTFESWAAAHDIKNSQAVLTYRVSGPMLVITRLDGSVVAEYHAEMDDVDAMETFLLQHADRR